MPDKLITPEEVFHNRRRFLRDMGFAGAGLVGAPGFAASKDNKKYYPAKKNAALSSQLPPGTKLTPAEWIAGYNNFYEFTTEKYYVKHPFYMDKFSIDPWKIRVDGLCKKPLAVDAHAPSHTTITSHHSYKLSNVASIKSSSSKTCRPATIFMGRILV